ncbi:uncharacterized protein LOC135503175 [Lineus longissimus]|uniref:uncharacterized protein LOC135503175 n=1 Tax=Lineus longissimus TaxID=88925 RepID=UPI002B4F02FA
MAEKPPPGPGFNVDAPPPYEKAAPSGQPQAQQPAGQPQQAPWKLSYADFWPNKLTDSGLFSLPTFEPFGACMQRANQWLQQNPNVEVILCESAEERIEYGGTINPEKTYFHVSGKFRTLFVRGLRLWFGLRLTPGPPLQISYINTVPGMIRGGGFLREAQFERLPQVLDGLNKMFKENPLPGKIINIETQDMKLDAQWSGNMSIAPDQSVFSDGGDHGVFYLFVIRVFYVCGPPAYEEVGMVDFSPRCLSAGGMMKMPSFQGFSAATYQAAQWIQQYQQSIRITNIQSIDIKMNMRGFGSGNLTVDNQAMSFYEYGKMSTCYIRNVRVCYTKPFNGAPPSPAPPIALAVKVFYPVQLSNVGMLSMPSFETFSQTMQRAGAWLQVVGRRVISVETVPVFMTVYEHMAQHGGGNGAECSMMIGGGDNMTSYQFVIRVYLDGPYQEPPAEVLPPLPPSAQNVTHWTQENRKTCRLM